MRVIHTKSDKIRAVQTWYREHSEENYKTRTPEYVHPKEISPSCGLGDIMVLCIFTTIGVNEDPLSLVL